MISVICFALLMKELPYLLHFWGMHDYLHCYNCLCCNSNTVTANGMIVTAVCFVPLMNALLFSTVGECTDIYFVLLLEIVTANCWNRLPYFVL